MPDSAEPILSIRPHPQAIVAAVMCRQLNHDTSQRLRTELEAAVAQSPTLPLVLDVSQVEFMPSLAMGMLVTTHKTLTQAGRKCVVTGFQPFVLESLKLAGLHRFFVIHDTVDAGLNSL